MTCVGGESCISLQEPYGICHPSTCDLFAATSPCPQGNSLAPNQICTWGLVVGHTASMPFCALGGTAAIGQPCNTTATPPIYCAQGGVCLGDGTCHQVCDNSHSCTTGICGTATYSDGMGGIISAPGPNNGGWCF
jgi:hypothetical protein